MLGIGEAAFLVAMLSAAADLAPEGRTGEAISLASLALWLGVAIGPVIGEWLLGSGGGVDYAPVWIAAAVLSAIAALLALAVPETRPVAQPTADGEPRRRGPLFHPAGLLPGILVLCASWGMAGFIPFLPLHAADLGAAGAGPALAVYGGIIVVVRLFGARLPDRLGAGRLTAMALAITAVGLLLLGVLPGYAGPARGDGGVRRRDRARVPVDHLARDRARPGRGARLRRRHDERVPRPRLRPRSRSR